MGTLTDITGNRYGRGVVIGFEGMRRDKRGRTLSTWRLMCDCGTEYVANKSELTRRRQNHKTLSCGCLRKEVSCVCLDMGRKPRHGQTRTRTWQSWVSMKSRCLNPNPKLVTYRYYYGRGIKICERWLTFESFIADMGERPEGKTLDRIDGNGHYEPGNCKWSTPKEQTMNRRCSKKVVPNESA